MAMRDHPYRRTLLPDQACVVLIHDVDRDETREIFRTHEILLEAPNWMPSGDLILNGDGVLWRLAFGGALSEIALPGLPFLNNDHVPGPDGDTMFVSGYDWHIHRTSLSRGVHEQITRDDPERPLRHFLHGVSGDGQELAFVGIEPRGDNPWGDANIYTMPAAGGPVRQITFGSSPADGSEYAPGDDWIYFNTEAFSDRPGHAQIARIPRGGGPAEQLTSDDRVNWFPHLAPVGNLACYLSYPPGTTGHPENRPVELRLVRDGGWESPETVASILGGQGTINVNSWSPDGRSFAFVAYPRAGS